MRTPAQRKRHYDAKFSPGTRVRVIVSGWEGTVTEVRYIGRDVRVRAIYDNNGVEDRRGTKPIELEVIS